MVGHNDRHQPADLVLDAAFRVRIVLLAWRRARIGHYAADL